MTLTHKITYHTGVRVLGRATGLIAGIFIVGYLTRYLGKEGYGQYIAVIAFLQFFAIIADFGLYQVTMQMISEPNCDSQKITNNIFTLRFCLAIILLLISIGVGFLIPSYTLEIKLGISLASLAIFFILLNQILVAIYQKHIQMVGVSFSELLGKLLNLGIIILVVSLNWGFYATLLALVIGNAFPFVFNFLNLRKIIKIKFGFDWTLWKKILGLSWPIGLSIIFSSLYFKMDTIILSIFRPTAEVGIYGASYQMVEVLNSFPALLVGLIMPIISQAWANNDKARFIKIMEKSFNGIIILAVPVVFGGFVLADRIMLLVAGDDFSASGSVLKILIFAIGFLFIGQLFGHAVIAIKKQRQMMWNYLAVAIVGVVGYFVLIPRYSYYAAASITILTEFLVAILSIRIVNKALGTKLKTTVFFKALLSAIIMAIAVYYLLSLHVFILIPLGAIIYFACLYLFKTFSKNQILEFINFKKLWST